MLTQIESIEVVGESVTRIRLACGHAVNDATPHLLVGAPYNCPACIERRPGLQLPKPEDVLEAIADDYVGTMQAQGFMIGEPERMACLRAANIQYAWFCAITRALQ